MRRSEAFVFGLVAFLFIFVLFGSVYASVDDFRFMNPFWNGYSRLNSLLSPSTVQNLTRLEEIMNPVVSVLFVIGPSQNFMAEEVLGVKWFLENGGVLLVADDFGSANDLLAGLDISTHFSDFMMLDTLYRLENSKFCRIVDFNFSPITNNVSALTFNYPTVLANLDTEVDILAYSSPFSYLDLDMNGSPDEGEPTGPFPVIIKVKQGVGDLVILSDSSMFINSMLDKDDNTVFLLNLVGERDVYVDISHWEPSLFTQFKLILNQIYFGLNKVYFFTSGLEVKYTILALVSVVIFGVRWRRDLIEVDDQLEETLHDHPGWSRATLIKLKDLRDKVAN